MTNFDLQAATDRGVCIIEDRSNHYSFVFQMLHVIRMMICVKKVRDSQLTFDSEEDSQN
jgi:hypothetical protein